MLNFDEELKKFKPCLEIEEAEDAINNNELNDITDIIKSLIKDNKDQD